LLAYAHAGYPAVLWLLVRARFGGRGATESGRAASGAPPVVSLIVAAHDYPPERLELIVASDGSTDRTVARARSAGADLVLDLPRGGKVVAQDRAVERARGDLLAFSDANSAWAPDALRRLAGPFADLSVGYVCGTVSFHGSDGTNQEGLYWRYENVVRELESRLAGITAGNGAIYAVRRAAYMRLDPRTSHDLSFPFNMVRRGWQAVYEPAARAEEAMAPSVEGEFRRKRRMMRHAWPTVLGGGLLDPRGYGPLYALEVASHRLLRYASPALHLAVLGSSAALARREGRLFAAALAAQVGVLAAAAAAPAIPSRPARVARYYVLVTAALAAGLGDHLRAPSPTFWDHTEGAR
jgi:catechol 2,3-dioxygenase-like lactoylglutathione lyase family enzyme